MGCSSSIPDTSRSIEKKMPKEVSQKVAKKTLRDQSVAIIMETELEDVDTNSNIQENMKFQRKGHAAIAFAIDMDGNELQRIVGRSRTPKRLKALEPLNVPRFTSEMLAEKQKQLDNKSQMLEEKMKKAKLQREMQRQALIDKQKHQEEYAKRVREKPKNSKKLKIKLQIVGLGATVPMKAILTRAVTLRNS